MKGEAEKEMTRRRGGGEWEVLVEGVWREVKGASLWRRAMWGVQKERVALKASTSSII